MGTNRIIFLISAGLIVLTAAIFFAFNQKWKHSNRTLSEQVIIEETWELPRVLREVSGIAFLDNSRVAAVQDEDGIIFIYNLETSEIEQQIKFAGSGDYEGIAIDGSTAYVINSKGSIFIVKNFETAPEVEQVSTGLSSRNNPEGLVFDKRKERLLVAVKEKDPHHKDYKGIYELDPLTKRVNEKPVYRLNFEEQIFDEIRKKNVQRIYYPSELSIDPATGNILILEAEDPRLLVLDPSGKPIQLYVLERGRFPQPEGLAFDKAGKMYISNEGNPATIHQVKLKK